LFLLFFFVILLLKTLLVGTQVHVTHNSASQMLFNPLLLKGISPQ
jgi:hypothetical protein